jgi:hypothetical protein
MMVAPRGDANDLYVWEGLEGVKSSGALKSTMGGQLLWNGTFTNAYGSLSLTPTII